MGGFFTSLLAKFGQLATWFGNLFKGAFNAAWDMLRDLVTWTMIGVFDLLNTILQALPGVDAFSALNPGQYLSSLPPELVNMLGMMRIGEAFAIILAAILIKLTLQIIPFTRLGS